MVIEGKEAMRYKVIKNPDTEFLKEFKRKLKNNSGYCPCKIQKISANKCPCEQYRTTQDCYCGLYIKVPTYEDEET